MAVALLLRVATLFENRHVTELRFREIVISVASYGQPTLGQTGVPGLPPTEYYGLHSVWV